MRVRGDEGMKTCPRCGRKFNWWQRMVGEAKEHYRVCTESLNKHSERSISATCRGCPAGCYERMDNETYK